MWAACFHSCRFNVRPNRKLRWARNYAFCLPNILCVLFRARYFGFQFIQLLWAQHFTLSVLRRFTWNSHEFGGRVEAKHHIHTTEIYIHKMLISYFTTTELSSIAQTSQACRKFGWMLCVLSQAKSLNETAFTSQIKANPNELPPGLFQEERFF